MASTLNASSSGSGGLIASGDASGVLQLQSNGVTTATVDTSGNLGLGVTPSAWGSNFKVLDGGAGGGLAFNSSTVNTSLAVNAYNDNTNWKYKTTSAASLYLPGANSHYWYVAPSGTAGNNITFTTAMTLDASGRLLVGTTSAGNMNGRVIASNATGISSIGTVSGSGTGALDTGIPINQSNGAGCIVLVASRNTSAGTNTDAAVYIVRFYFDGNNAPTTVYVGGSANFVTFGVSGSNTLTLTNAAGGNQFYSWFGNK